jgi:Pyruvate/2-oxoacid:ferredoxin oxidoreductase delta subunit
MLAFSGDGALVAERHLRKKGYRVKQAVNTHMPNNLKLPYPVIGQFPIYGEEQKTKILGYAEVKISKLVEKIVKDEEWVEGRGLLGIIGGVFQRVLVVFTGWSRWARNFFVDYDACINCNQCVEYCPTENITRIEDQYQWGEKCICCLRCYNMCPTDAIQYKNATMDRIRFPRYKGPIQEFSIESMVEE